MEYGDKIQELLSKVRSGTEWRDLSHTEALILLEDAERDLRSLQQQRKDLLADRVFHCELIRNTRRGWLARVQEAKNLLNAAQRVCFDRKDPTAWISCATAEVALDLVRQELEEK